MNITTRLATPADALDIVEVLIRSWEVAYKDIIPTDFIKERNTIRPEQYRQRITDENRTYYVIQADNKTVGYMRVVDAPGDDDAACETADLEQIYLHHDYFRHGIGTKAVGFAFDVARNLGKTVMTV